MSLITTLAPLHPTEAGVYIKVKLAIEAHGKIPFSFERFARISGCDTDTVLQAWDAIGHLFVKEGNYLMLPSRGGKPSDDDWVLPSGFDTPELREALARYAEMRSGIRKPIRSKKRTSAVFKRFSSVADLVDVVNFVVENEYQGIKPDYVTKARATRPDTSNPTVYGDF